METSPNPTIALIQGQVDQAGRITGPFNRPVAVPNNVGQVLACLEVPDADLVELTALAINGIGQEAVIRARIQCVDPEELLTLCLGISVEQDLFAVRVQRPAAVDGVLTSDIESPVVLPRSV